MIEYLVICESLDVRKLPRNDSEKIGTYRFGEIIKTRGEPFEGEDNSSWICCIDDKDKLGYLCYKDTEKLYLIKYAEIKGQIVKAIKNEFIYNYKK